MVKAAGAANNFLRCKILSQQIYPGGEADILRVVYDLGVLYLYYISGPINQTSTVH